MFPIRRNHRVRCFLEERPAFSGAIDGIAGIWVSSVE